MTDEALDPLAYKGILPGTRVKVFDHLLYKNDKVTPLSDTMKDATVVRHYGSLVERYSDDLILGPYPSCIDVVFDHRPDKISKGHFTYAIRIFSPWFDLDFIARYNKRFVS
jgi:hypothetical protein